MNLKTKSIFISIIGKPNVGKSSLMNLFIDSKVSIVSPKPQTTRSKIKGIFTFENTQFVFIDTPGIHKPFNKLSQHMSVEIDNSLSGIEICIHVIDATKKSIDYDTIKKLEKSKIKSILLINKIDLLKNKEVLMEKIKSYSELFNYEAIIPISALSGDGKIQVLSELEKYAEPSVFFFPEDSMTDQSEKVLVSELIREKLLYFLEKELPHGTAVQVEKFEVLKNGNITIHAVILCEKQSHKSIIVGSRGNMIKKIGIESRKSIKNLLDCDINLNLFVKVKENWRNKPSVLNDLGYL